MSQQEPDQIRIARQLKKWTATGAIVAALALIAVTVTLQGGGRMLCEAVRLAKGAPYGLGASVWGTDPESLEAVARRLDAGTVWINQHLNVHPNVPFSGHKNSGIGIEFGKDGLKEFCNLQVIANRR
jgi:hypothetical protein